MAEVNTAFMPLQPTQAGGEVVVEFVVAELLLEGAKFGVAVDDGQFDAGDCGEVFHVFGGDSVAESGVVRAAGVNPGGAGGLEIGAAFPDGARYGELWQ